MRVLHTLIDPHTPSSAPTRRHEQCPPPTHAHTQELRKDKAQRDPGGVTPGEDPNYYAAVARADEEAEAVKKPSKPILRAGGGQRAGGPNKVTDSAANGGGRGSPGGSDEGEGDA
eukprot:278752-Chlamydomonas_euryale.AAC.1